jgi:hypothetical protein
VVGRFIALRRKLRHSTRRRFRQRARSGARALLMPRSFARNVAG